MLRTSLERLDLTGSERRSPLGMKWWSLQALRKDRWQEYVAILSVRMDEVLHRLATRSPKREIMVALKVVDGGGVEDVVGDVVAEDVVEVEV